MRNTSRGGHKPSGWNNICLWPTCADGHKKRQRAKKKQKVVALKIVRIPAGRSRWEILNNL